MAQQFFMQRTITRIFHLVLSIPILGYIYSPISQVSQYAQPTRFIFVPALILSGLWIYAGLIFALVAVAIWIGVVALVGFLPACLSQLILLVCYQGWLRRKRNRSIQIENPLR